MKSKVQFQLNLLARGLAWCTAVVYIAIETKYALEAQTLLNITSFAVLFLLASLQFSIARLLQKSKRQVLAESTFSSGLLMVYAALFDLFDACLDEFIRRFQATLLPTSYTYFLHLISWVITIVAAVAAVFSLNKFLRTMTKITFKDDELETSKASISK